jgi:DNA-binding NarL/FixJ family response regulator
MKPASLEFLIIDDHALFSEGAALMLERRFPGSKVRTAPDGPGGLKCLRQYPSVALVLLDVRLGQTHGFDVLELLRKTKPSLPVVVVSSLEERPLMAEALARGASAFIPKSSPPERLCRELRRVLASPPPAEPAPASEEAPPAPNPVGAPRKARTLGLTARQQEVLRLVIQGLANKEIADRMALSPNTVRVHVADIFRVLGARSRSEAATKAQSLGWSRNA